MASVNKVILVGNLGRDPEMRTFPSGDQVANVTIATTDRWRDKNTGETKEATEWHRIAFHGRLAEIVGQYCRKGSQIYVEGSLRTRKWTDQQGVERYSTEIRADSMQLLGGRQGGNTSNHGYGGDDAGYGQQQGNYQPRHQSNPPGQRAPRQAPPQQQAAPNAYQHARNGNAPQQQAPAPRAASGFDDMDDDIPFIDPLRLSGSLHYAI